MKPVNLQNLLKSLQNDTKKVFFDVDGKPLLNLLNDLDKNQNKIVLMFGPEGGLTKQEEDLLKENDFEFYVLTPTVLRSVEAVAVGLGSVRSI